MTPYSGPRPSPARRWSPWVIIVAAAAAVGSAAQVVLNLVERHLMQQTESGNPPTVAKVRAAVSAIHTADHLTLVAVFAFLVVGVGWSISRRSRPRLARDGESGVEPSLRSVCAPVYGAFWICVVLSLVLSQVARSSVHVGSTPADFVQYRGYLAFARRGGRDDVGVLDRARLHLDAASGPA